MDPESSVAESAFGVPYLAVRVHGADEPSREIDCATPYGCHHPESHRKESRSLTTLRERRCPADRRCVPGPTDDALFRHLPGGDQGQYRVRGRQAHHPARDDDRGPRPDLGRQPRLRLHRWRPHPARYLDRSHQGLSRRCAPAAGSAETTSRTRSGSTRLATNRPWCSPLPSTSPRRWVLASSACRTSNSSSASQRKQEPASSSSTSPRATLTPLCQGQFRLQRVL